MLATRLIRVIIVTTVTTMILSTCDGTNENLLGYRCKYNSADAFVEQTNMLQCYREVVQCSQ